MSTQRIVIAGGPRCGKSYRAAELSRSLGIRALHSDDLIEPFIAKYGKRDAWSEMSAEVARWLGRPGPWIIEGVALSRALRKALKADPRGKPCDTVVHLTKPFVKLTPERETMLKGCVTVWDEISAELARRGVRVQLS